MSQVSFRNVQTERFHEDVGRQIARSIIRGDIAPGTALPSESILIKQFEVSRVVIREALRSLAQRGLVEMWQGRRTTVLPENRWDVLDPMILTLFREEGRIKPLVRDFLWIRRQLEPQIAADAARGSNCELNKDLTGILQQMEVLLEEPKLFFEADMAFHIRLAEATGNTVLRQLMTIISHLFNVSRDLTHEVATAPEGALEWHNRIYSAIEKGDSEGARDTMARHLEWTTERIMRSLASH